MSAKQNACRPTAHTPDPADMIPDVDFLACFPVQPDDVETITNLRTLTAARIRAVRHYKGVIPYLLIHHGLMMSIDAHPGKLCYGPRLYSHKHIGVTNSAEADQALHICAVGRYYHWTIEAYLRLETERRLDAAAANAHAEGQPRECVDVSKLQPCAETVTDSLRLIAYARTFLAKYGTRLGDVLVDGKTGVQDDEQQYKLRNYTQPSYIRALMQLLGITLQALSVVRSWTRPLPVDTPKTADVDALERNVRIMWECHRYTDSLRPVASLVHPQTIPILSAWTHLLAANLMHVRGFDDVAYWAVQWAACKAPFRGSQIVVQYTAEIKSAFVAADAQAISPSSVPRAFSDVVPTITEFDRWPTCTDTQLIPNDAFPVFRFITLPADTRPPPPPLPIRTRAHTHTHAHAHKHEHAVKLAAPPADLTSVTAPPAVALRASSTLPAPPASAVPSESSSSHSQPVASSAIPTPTTTRSPTSATVLTATSVPASALVTSTPTPSPAVDLPPAAAAAATSARRARPRAHVLLSTSTQRSTVASVPENL